MGVGVRLADYTDAARDPWASAPVPGAFSIQSFDITELIEYTTHPESWRLIASLDSSAWYDFRMDMGVVTSLIGTVAVGAALATLIVRLNRGLERQIDTVRDDVRELRRDQAGLRDRASQLSDRVSRIEGLLEGLREAIVGRHAAAD